MKKTLYILVAVVVLFAGYRLFVAPSRVKEGSIPYNTIVCFGDSLTYGTGAGPGKDYPSQLSVMIGKSVINAGVPGDTTASALKRLQRDVLDRSPDVVLITLGGNDLKNGVAKDIAFENLTRIVESVQDYGARVVIGGLKIPLRDRGFARGYGLVADQTGAVLIPHILEDIMGRRKLMSDPIHPNGEGYKIMAERFLEAMQE